jgi:ubiquinone/menaquinone biosynthesis C-methylase UbiE/chorismate mutase/quercetin dioxygenase-like cupin family protein
MREFPRFMTNPANAIAPHQQSEGVEGYVFDGDDGAQVAVFQCAKDGVSTGHVHAFDEYFVVVQGEYTLGIGGKRFTLRSGDEYVIPRGVPHDGVFLAGTRTINAFGGKRADRKTEGLRMDLSDIRNRIDRVDGEIIKLLARRAGLVSAAGKLKKDEEGVRDPKRVEQVIGRVREKAAAAGLDPAIAGEIYRTIIGCFIRSELRDFTSGSGDPAGSSALQAQRHGTAKGRQPMNEQQRKEMLRQTFDTVAGGYDKKALRFFPRSADLLASLLGMEGNEHVLDVACGTGHASLAIARKLSKGRVTAVDFSPGMLGEARNKASSLGVRNIEFLEGDMQDLRFPAGHFDIAVCAFGIFFVEDMDAQLAHILSAVRPGGRVMISTFEETYFQPLRDLLTGRLATYGVTPPPPAWRRTATVEGCRRLFEQAGLADIRAESRNVGYFLDGPGEWWDVVWNAGFRRLVGQLAAEEQERFKQEHLREVEALRTQDGIRLDVGVLYTVGTKPGGG